MTSNEKLEQLIRAHPLAAVGGALACGAFAGILAAGKHRGPVGRAVSAAVSGVMVSLVRNLIFGGAKSWIDQRDRPAATQAATSYEPAVENFFEH